VRHDTLDIFAALNVATRQVIACCKRQHRAAGLRVAFLLREVEASGLGKIPFASVWSCVRA
jgi:hypothetical protein